MVSFFHRTNFFDVIYKQKSETIGNLKFVRKSILIPEFYIKIKKPECISKTKIIYTTESFTSLLFYIKLFILVVKYQTSLEIFLSGVV